MPLDTEYARQENVEEDRVIGSVSSMLYLDYIRAGMRTASVVALLVFFLANQGKPCNIIHFILVKDIKISRKIQVMSSVYTYLRAFE